MQNWSSWVVSSSFGIHTPSATLHWSGILPLLQKTRRIFHRPSRNLGQFLYTLYELPLGPGAELDLALRTTSLTSFSCSSDMSNCTSGSGRSMRMLHSPSSCSLAGSMYVCFRCWSVFQRGGKFTNALLPQQILGELKGVGDKGSALTHSLTPPPPMALSPAENPDLFP